MYEKRGIFNEKNYFLDNDLLSNHVYSVIFFKKLKNAAQTIITSCFFPRIGQWLFIFVTLQLRPTACKAHLLVQLPDLKPFVRLPEKNPKAIILFNFPNKTKNSNFTCWIWEFILPWKYWGIYNLLERLSWWSSMFSGAPTEVLSFPMSPDEGDSCLTKQLTQAFHRCGTSTIFLNMLCFPALLTLLLLVQKELRALSEKINTVLKK